MRTINKYGLKHQLNELLKAGKEITIDFNCGNDEAHIVPFVDGKIVEYGELYFSLEDLIFIDLNLPSAGEYMVTGKGYLTSEDDDIYLYYDLEGFMYSYDDEDFEESDVDYEPKKEIKEILNSNYLLLSKEYDDPEKLQEYFAEKEATQINKPVLNSFSASEQELWESLKGESSVKHEDSKKLQEHLQKKGATEINVPLSDNYLAYKKELWKRLNKASKPWWKFW
ncbi:hypothetical protein [Runella sp.]|uniref:hypothetical protein n=1 Tax=Runella sp. TaxID=1960881 RepID=UPI003D1044C9